MKKSILIISSLTIALNISAQKSSAKKSSAPAPVYHEAVDLGLSSGTLWASANIGADSPESLGSYFAWGEVDAKKSFTWNNYFFGEKGETRRYNHFDKREILEESDDAAIALWGNGWRTPTKAEWDELKTFCNWTWDEARAGYIIKSQAKGNKNSIFLRASGCINGDELLYEDFGFYWTSTVDPSVDDNAWFFNFTPGSYVPTSCPRFGGLQIRPVKSK